LQFPPVNTIDAKGMQHVCPDGGVYEDKAYCTNHAEHVAAKKIVLFVQ
jgi:hypothetical protein